MRSLFLSMVFLVAGTLAAQTPATKPTPNPVADRALEKIKSSKGPGYDVNRNPVFDQVAKREAAGIPFKDAVQPFTGCNPPGSKNATRPTALVVEDEKIATLAAAAKAEGVDCTFARNPVFDAIVSAETEKPFAQAAAPFLGAVPPKGVVRVGHVVNLSKATEAKWDSRAKGWVPPIRNQLNCGSCWDFAGVGGVEISILAQSGADPKSVDLSEQCVIDCEGSNGGCNGDWPETVLAMAKSKGLASEKDSPYKARRGTCSASLKFPYKVSDYGYIGRSDAVADTQAIKDAIRAYGSAVVAVAVDQRFTAYASGIFSGGATSINHAVILVGWDDEGGYWILRNTWDKTWGESGYMRIKYGSNQIGYGAMWAKAIVDAPAPLPPGPLPPAPGAGFTGTLTYKGGNLLSVTQGQRVDVEGDLQAAGVSPATIVAVLKLIQDIRMKAGKDVIMSDVFALLATLALGEQPKVNAPVAPKPDCCGQGQVAAPLEGAALAA